MSGRDTASELAGGSLRALVWLHRWTGVILCALFAMWFASGAVMVFVPFPSLGAEARQAHAASFDPGVIAVRPGDALAQAGGGDALRLVAIAGRPAYVVSRAEGAPTVIMADDGERVSGLGEEAAARVAGGFAGAPIRAVEGPVQYDQWIVHQQFDPLRPFYRVRVGDRAGTVLYVSSRTGEVVQRTRADERAWNWAGSVIHWLYVTPLRKSFAAWDQTVWWVSLAGVATTVLGLGLGLLRTTQSARRRGRASPFRGWMQWHHLIGLASGALVLSWIVSGWLSMDHGRLFSRGAAPAAAAARYSGLPLDRALARLSLSDLRGLGRSSEIGFGAVGGRALAFGAGGGDPSRRVVLEREGGAPLRRLPQSLIAAAVQAGWPAERAPALQPVSSSDFYAAAEGMAPSTLRARIVAPGAPSIYLDPVSGRLITVMDRSRAAYAWVYYGLHTLRLPGLIERPTLWRVLILLGVALGFAFSITGVVVGWRRLARRL